MHFVFILFLNHISNRYIYYISIKKKKKKIYTNIYIYIFVNFFIINYFTLHKYQKRKLLPVLLKIISILYNYNNFKKQFYKNKFVTKNILYFTTHNIIV